MILLFLFLGPFIYLVFRITLTRPFYYRSLNKKAPNFWDYGPYLFNMAFGPLKVVFQNKIAPGPMRKLANKTHLTKEVLNFTRTINRTFSVKEN